MRNKWRVVKITELKPRLHYLCTSGGRPSYGTWQWTVPLSAWKAPVWQWSSQWRWQPSSVLWVGCRRRQFLRCWVSIPQSKRSSCFGCWEAARQPPSLTCGRGRRRPLWDISHAGDRRPPSCSWRRTSAEWAPGRWGLCNQMWYVWRGYHGPGKERVTFRDIEEICT